MKPFPFEMSGETHNHATSFLLLFAHQTLKQSSKLNEQQVFKTIHKVTWRPDPGNGGNLWFVTVTIQR